VEQARELGHEVYLSHPKQTKAIASARLKSDKVDALMLARLLKADLLPMVWIPGDRERYMRELLSHRAMLGRARTTVINELHAVYAKRNVELIGRVRLRAHPIPLRVKELSGYALRIVKVNRHYVCKWWTIERGDERSNDTPWFEPHRPGNDRSRSLLQ